jgi:enoyl-CoA hydratase/carnithine racemase
MNAVDLATEAELQRIWTQIENDRDVRVVVLTGAGERAFCAGADMKNPSVTGLEYWAASARRRLSAASRCARRSTCR